MIYLFMTRIKHQKSRRILLMRIIYVNSKKVMLYFLTIWMLPKPHTRMSQIIIVLIPHKRNRRIELEIVYGCYDVMLKPLGVVISWIIYDWLFCHLWSNQWYCILPCLHLCIYTQYLVSLLVVSFWSSCYTPTSN